MSLNVSFTTHDHTPSPPRLSFARRYNADVVRGLPSVYGAVAPVGSVSHLHIVDRTVGELKCEYTCIPICTRKFPALPLPFT
jgi:hypothetical protein